MSVVAIVRGRGQQQETVRLASENLSQAAPTGVLPIPGRAQADAVVSLHWHGSFDKSALEGMSCGLPLLTMNPAFAPHLSAAGMPGPIEDGNAEALAQAIERLADAPVEERRRWGLALRAEMVRAHSLQRLADLLVNQIL